MSHSDLLSFKGKAAWEHVGRRGPALPYTDWEIVRSWLKMLRGVSLDSSHFLRKSILVSSLLCTAEIITDGIHGTLHQTPGFWPCPSTYLGPLESYASQINGVLNIPVLCVLCSSAGDWTQCLVYTSFNWAFYHWATAPNLKFLINLWVTLDL